MKRNRLGNTGLEVSELCLGTMTFGTRTGVDEAHAQIDMALDHGINILDTAELYPVGPISAATQGDSERIVGQWVSRSGRRGDVLIATKVTGQGVTHIRNGAPISMATIREAIECSLRSLRTDYIDLYQLHWPNRPAYTFRRNWTFDPSSQDLNQILEHMSEVLETLQGLVNEGKIRFIGLSNESAWGTARWLRTAEDRGLPKVQTIQNEYSLLCRLFDTDLSELAHNERVGLLAYSPLATGLLTGKYRSGAVPDGSRMSLNPDLAGRATKRAHVAVDRYFDVARRHGLDLIHMALAWCRTRPFMASAIFGATRLAHLEHILRSVTVTLSEDCLMDIDKAHRDNPMPF